MQEWICSNTLKNTTERQRQIKSGSVLGFGGSHAQLLVQGALHERPSQNSLSLDADNEIQRWQEPSGSGSSYCACFPLQTHANRSWSLHARPCCRLHRALAVCPTALGSRLPSEPFWRMDTAAFLIRCGEWWAPSPGVMLTDSPELWGVKTLLVTSHHQMKSIVKFHKRTTDSLSGENAVNH